MRSRPATRTAFCFGGYSVCLTTRGARSAHGLFRSEERNFQRAGQNRPAKISLRHLLCNTTVASGQFLRLWRTLLRRPQRPGNHHASIFATPVVETIRAANQPRFWGTLPAIHPRESPGSASSAVMLGKAYENISLVCEHSARFPFHKQQQTRARL